MSLLYLFIGGGLGSLFRYLVATGLNRRGAKLHPWGTFAVNISGAYLLGLSLHVPFPSDLSAGVIQGFFGGFTTFSTFMLEGESLLDHRKPLLAGIYLLGTLALGVCAFLMGFYSGIH